MSGAFHRIIANDIGELMAQKSDKEYCLHVLLEWELWMEVYKQSLNLLMFAHLLYSYSCKASVLTSFPQVHNHLCPGPGSPPQPRSPHPRQDTVQLDLHILRHVSNV